MTLLKRSLSLMLAAAAVFGSLTGCADMAPQATAAEPESTPELIPTEFKKTEPEPTEEPISIELESWPVTVEGTIFGGSKDEPVHTELKYADDLLIETDNTGYSRAVAELSALLCADVYFRDKDLAKGTQNRVLVNGEDSEAYDHTALLKTLGFSEAEYIETFKAGEYDKDTNDSATMLMGHKTVNGEYDLFVVVLRGCFSAQEWLSIYDLGADSEAYTELTGEHPEWVKPNQPKGTSIAAQRAESFLRAFMEENSDPSRKQIVLLTGHSRGAALANLIGAKLEEEGKVKSFTYTFNTPCVDTAAVPGKHNTVFNIFDSADLFTDHLPLGKEVLYRNGTDVTTFHEEALGEAFEELTGRSMPSALSEAELNEFRTLFAGRFETRADLYEFHTITETFASKEEADARYEECLKLIGAEEGLGLEPFCKVGKVTKAADGYTVDIACCDAAWLICYAKTLAYGNSAYEAAVNLLAGDEGGCKVAAFLGSHGAQINAGHLLVRSYLVASQAD